MNSLIIVHNVPGITTAEDLQTAHSHIGALILIIFKITLSSTLRAVSFVQFFMLCGFFSIIAKVNLHNTLLTSPVFQHRINGRLFNSPFCP